jgi:hypothetical protein
MSSNDGGRRVRSFRYSVILPHPSERKALLIPDDDAWALPSWATGDQDLWESMYVVNGLVREHLGLRARALRAIHLDRATERDELFNIYQLENLDPAWQPPAGARWLSCNELSEISMTRPQERAALETWFAANGAAHPTPWYNPGWLDTAADWFRAQAERAGCLSLGDVEHVRAWQRSAVLHLPTTNGDLYLKAVPPMFAHELRLSGWLEVRFPEHAVRTIAHDDELRWAITRDFGGQPLSEVRELAIWEDAYQRYAELQIALLEHEPELTALGCPVRAPSALVERLEALLMSDDALLIGRDGGLTGEQARQLRGKLQYLRQCCEELAATPLPLALDHGDLWPANIVWSEGRFIYFDWSDCALTHPFFSMILCMEDAQSAFPDQPEVPGRVRRAYLAPWAERLPGGDLDASFELAWHVGALHYALLYWEDILPNLNPRWELNRMVPFYLRLVLERLSAGVTGARP